MGAFEDYLEELRLKEEQRRAQETADLNDLTLAKAQRIAEINDQTLSGEYTRHPATLTGITAEQAQREREEYAANRPKQLENRLAKEMIGKEQAIRNTSREQSNQYYDQARRVASLNQMRFGGVDPQFDEKVPYDDESRTQRVLDPTTNRVIVQPKPGLDERKTRIAEYAKHVQIPEEVVSRRFDEDMLAQFKATEELAGIKTKQAERLEAERQIPYLREKAHITMAQQLGKNPAMLRALELDPNQSEDMIRAVNYARIAEQGVKELGEDTSLRKWEVHFFKEHARNFDEAVKRGEGSYNGIDIESMVDEGLQPGERPKMITEFLTKLARAQALGQVQLFRDPAYRANMVGSNINDAATLTEQQVGPTMPGVEYGGTSSPLREPGMAPQAAPGGETKVMGRLASGRPVVQNPDGSTSTHKNMIASFGDKFYIVPTMYGGNFYEPDDAADIIRRNNLIDPDTGQPLVAYPSQEAAEMEEKRLHDALEQEAMVPTQTAPTSLQEMLYTSVPQHTPRGGRGMVYGGPGNVAQGRANPTVGQVPRREFGLPGPGGRGVPAQGPPVRGGGRGIPDFYRPGISLEEWLWRARQQGKL